MTVLLEPIGAVRSGCLNCPPRPARLNLNRDVHPGFGWVSLERDGEIVWDDVHGGLRHGRRAENAALKDPDHDWRLVIDGPLYGVVYQRHAPGEWYAVEKSEGFA